ncbi:MAG: methyltransferase domain-containing protein, partial [Myxococcota bacterium]|nr:methyltransferase domain-containing protein [Myxococcota bacterium]
MHDKLMQITQQASWHDRLPRYAYLAHLVRDKRVLDLGCGTGEGAALLAEAGARQVLAIDPSSASIEHARATYELPNLSFIARFVEDPLDAGQLTESGDFDSADPLAAADAFEAQLTSVRIAAPSPLETQSTESDDAPSEPPEGEESGTQPALAEPEQVHEAIAEPEPTHEAELAPESTETVPALEPDLGPEPSSETEAPLESESAPQSTSAGGGERFDIVLAINPDLPINDPAFLQRLLSFLDEGGFLVVSARIDGSHCLSDLLAHFEPGTNPGEPVTFADSEALRQHFAQLGLSAREVVQHAALSTRFAPANEPERAIDRVFGSTRESIPRFRLFFLFKGEARDVGAFECHVPLEPLVAQLGEGINALVSRISRLEHRALLVDEQRAQNVGLTDDLVEELRRA